MIETVQRRGEFDKGEGADFWGSEFRESEPGLGPASSFVRPQRLGLGLLSREGDGIYEESRKNEFGVQLWSRVLRRAISQCTHPTDAGLPFGRGWTGGVGEPASSTAKLKQRWSAIFIIYNLLFHYL